jgi:hypothetical protein
MVFRNGITGLRPVSARGWALAVDVSMIWRALDHALHPSRHRLRNFLRKKSINFSDTLHSVILMSDRTPGCRGRARTDNAWPGAVATNSTAIVQEFVASARGERVSKGPNEDSPVR